MPLHQKTPIRHRADDETYAASDLAQVLPKHRFASPTRDPRNDYAAVRDELLLDGNARQNLATFCQTWGEPEVHQLMDDCIDKNMVDKDEYPQTAEIEARCVHMLADLWNAPADPGGIGCSTTGSSETAMLGGLALKRRWEARRRAEGKPFDKPNLITGPVQICWHKFTRYWDIEHREIPLENGRMLMTPEEVLARCDENTIGVVPTLGVTFTGRYEPVEAVSEALDGLRASTGLDIPIHVDGASGGFLAPFCAPDLVWDFRLDRVKFINASGHKFGLAPLGVGWVIWRSPADLTEEMVFHVNYLGGDMRDIALNFSRPGGQVVCQYYNFIRLGREGYTKVHSACYDTAKFLTDRIAAIERNAAGHQRRSRPVHHPTLVASSGAGTLGLAVAGPSQEPQGRARRPHRGHRPSHVVRPCRRARRELVDRNAFRDRIGALRLGEPSGADVPRGPAQRRHVLRGLGLLHHRCGPAVPSGGACRATDARRRGPHGKG